MTEGDRVMKGDRPVGYLSHKHYLAPDLKIIGSLLPGDQSDEEFDWDRSQAARVQELIGRLTGTKHERLKAIQELDEVIGLLYMADVMYRALMGTAWNNLARRAAVKERAREEVQNSPAEEEND
jgi:hypothetical protein